MGHGKTVLGKMVLGRTAFGRAVKENQKLKNKKQKPVEIKMEKLIKEANSYLDRLDCVITESNKDIRLDILKSKPTINSKKLSNFIKDLPAGGGYIVRLDMNVIEKNSESVYSNLAFNVEKNTAEEISKKFNALSSQEKYAVVKDVLDWKLEGGIRVEGSFKTVIKKL